MIKKKSPKKPLNKYARFSGVAFQMAVTIFIGTYIGTKLDEKFPNENNIFTLVFSLIFVFAALYTVIKQVKNISE
jgi:uncharacterized membrane protein YfcA